jgi:hypothetical protein
MTDPIFMEDLHPWSDHERELLLAKWHQGSFPLGLFRDRDPIRLRKAELAKDMPAYASRSGIITFSTHESIYAYERLLPHEFMHIVDFYFLTAEDRQRYADMLCSHQPQHSWRIGTDKWLKLSEAWAEEARGAFWPVDHYANYAYHALSDKQRAGVREFFTEMATEPEPASSTPPPSVPTPTPAPTPTPDLPFEDLAGYPAEWIEAVRWAKDSGITKGTSATTFSPDQSITRGQFVVMLWRLAQRIDGGPVQ